jgi:hypothetical protein
VTEELEEAVVENATAGNDTTVSESDSSEEETTVQS